MSDGYTTLNDEFFVVSRKLTNEVLELIKREQALRVLAATSLLDAAAKQHGERTFIQDQESGGYTDWMMAPAVYQAFRRKWGAAALNDQEFIRHCVSKGSAVRVKNKNATPKVGYRKGLEGLQTVTSGSRRSRQTFSEQPQNN